MSNDDIRKTSEAINLAIHLFKDPSSREEEEICHLLNTILDKIYRVHEERQGYPYNDHNPTN